MDAKIIEIRDEATFIAVLCVDMNPDIDDDFTQRYYLRREGYSCNGKPNILITRLSADGAPATNDPYYWQGRTWPVAHHYILEHWAELENGSVVDVSYILGETDKPKISERFTPSNF